MKKTLLCLWVIVSVFSTGLLAQETDLNPIISEALDKAEQDDAQFEPLVETIKVDFADIKEIAHKIETLLISEIGRVDIGERANTLMVYDYPENLTEIKLFVEKNDFQDIKIKLRASIYSITLNNEYSQGVQWKKIVSDYQSIEFLEFKQNIETKNFSNLAVGTLSKDDLIILIEALRSFGDIHQNESLELLTRNTQEDEILVSYQDNNQLKKRSKNSDAIIYDKVKIFYTPYYRNNQISLTLRPEIYGAGVSSQNQAASIVVSLGSTVVIGGLFKNVIVETRRKIPFLGDIPFLGVFFQDQNQTLQKSETIIFLTPEILI